MQWFLLSVLVAVWGPTHCGSQSYFKVNERVADDLDVALDSAGPLRVPHVQILYYGGKQLTIKDQQSVLESLCILEAPLLDELEVYSMKQFTNLIIRNCLLTGLKENLFVLHNLAILKIERCRMGGSLNLAPLLLFRNLTEFSLEGNQLTEVVLKMNEFRALAPSTLRYLNLGGNWIDHFHLEVLSALPHLEELYLYRNRLVTVEGSIELPALKTIVLKMNNLTDLNFTGCNCSALEFVCCSDNKLREIPAFSALSTRIVTLDVSNNELETLNLEALSQHQHLKYLTLSGNALGSLNHHNGSGPMVELPRLYNLIMNSNGLESLNLDRWVLPQLRMIRVQDNPLTQLPDDLLERFPMLKNLGCFCPGVGCAWVERNMAAIRNGVFQMTTSRDNSSCVAVPRIGCVSCVVEDGPATEQPTTETVE